MEAVYVWAEVSVRLSVRRGRAYGIELEAGRERSRVHLSLISIHPPSTSREHTLHHRLDLPIIPINLHLIILAHLLLLLAHQIPESAFDGLTHCVEWLECVWWERVGEGYGGRLRGV
jgi:hypothetical protein